MFIVFFAMRLLSITATLGVALHALTGVAAVPSAAGTRPLSSPLTEPPDSTFTSQAASPQGPVMPSSQLASDGSVALEGVKIVVVCLASAAMLWRIWGILKNTGAWRYLLLLLGVDPAAQPDEEAAAHGRLLIDGDPTAGVELSLAPAAAVPGTQLVIPNLNVSELSGAPGCPPGTIFTRECTWTATTASSMSTRESHYSQPANTSSA